MVVKVITPPAAEPLTLQEVKVNQRIPFDDEDADIERMIRAARQMAETRLNRALMPQVLEFAADGFCGPVEIPRPPLASTPGITVKYLDADGAQQTLDPAAYLLNEYVDPPTISAAYGAPWPATRAQQAAVVVRYSAGYADAASVPEPIRQWMLLAIGAMYENRAAVGEVETYSLPDDFMCSMVDHYQVIE